MIPGTGNLSAKLRGDYWAGIPSITISPTPQGSTGTLSAARMQWRGPDNSVAIEFTTADGTMTISDDGTAQWVLAIPGRDLNVAANSYRLDLQCQDSSGNFFTPWRGTVEVQQDVTSEN